MTWTPNRRTFNTLLASVAGTSALGLTPSMASTIKVAGIYTQPIQQKWDARLHQGLEAAKAKGEIEYVFSEKVANTDYIRVLREYCESGVKLIVGEAFGISKEARKVADEYPEIAFLMGDPFEPHGSNFAVFDNYIHEPCYLMGMIAGAMTKTNKLGMVGGYPIGEVNRLFHAFINGALKSVNPGHPVQGHLHRFLVRSAKGKGSRVSRRSRPVPTSCMRSAPVWLMRRVKKVCWHSAMSMT